MRSDRTYAPAAVQCERAAALAEAMEASGLGPVARGVPLAPDVRWKIGGPASLMFAPRDAVEVAQAIITARRYEVPIFVLGDGSNMLIDSRGINGLVIRMGQNMSSLRIEGNRVLADAGVWVPRLALELARRGLSGLEHVAGIPGRLGGLVLMNGGSQRKSVGSNVLRVHTVTREGILEKIEAADLAFSYRCSALQGSGTVVTGVDLQLESSHPDRVRRTMIEILAARRNKFPKNLPNCGSTFLSNPAMYDTVGPPGRLIEEAGLKGFAIGGAQVSPLHANFIVNRGGATSNDVMALIGHIRDVVFERTGYRLACEARFISFEGEERPIHEFTDRSR